MPYRLGWKGWLAGTLGVALFAMATMRLLAPVGAVASADRMPEFPRKTAEAWLNSTPLKASDQRGKVVLLEVYASG
jgi:hypothetical protein